jgi:hypothetical protein
MSKLFTVIGFCTICWLIKPAFAAPLSNNDMLNFLTQSLCLDAAGKPTSQIPVVDTCTSMRPQRADDRAVYQKHDWPDARVYPHYFLTGHQASDSVLVNSTATPAVEQTMDFGGDPQHQFGYFDTNDAGQVVLLVDGWASIVMTQDLHSGIVWFVGKGCQSSPRTAALSWLLFNRTVPTGQWADVVANLNITHSPSDCPQRFNLAFTRYRREHISFPFRLVKGNDVTTTSLPLDVIITEHFAGAAANPASNASLERFFFARYLGWVRWERWENLSNVAIAPRRTTDIRLAQNLVPSRRCPAVAYSTSPGPGWYEVDCRTWTTIVRITKPWSVSDYHWGALENARWQ